MPTRTYNIATYDSVGIQYLSRPMSLDSARRIADKANEWHVEKESAFREIVLEVWK